MTISGLTVKASGDFAVAVGVYVNVQEVDMFGGALEV